ncbi:MAG: 1-acyl-sn-glycerol-3-phosphate acyltransferase [Treponema sp.]|nr:1-acyl-sn-glycerol-3-phosphate acyltransferase [Candidatus Treponema caballi]
MDEGTRLDEKYGYLVDELKSVIRAQNKIDDTNIYQESNPNMLPVVDRMLAENFLPGSGVVGRNNISAFMEQVRNGKHGLVLCEHYSNFDLPGLHYILRKDGGEDGKELADKLVAIAGMKLNEDNAMVSALAEAFSRIVIYPSRSLASIKDPAKRAEEEARSKKINFASMRYLDQCRRRGQVIMVFPSGTRYRPGVPDTKRGVREIDSYLRLTDVFLPVSINGNCLRISEDDPKNMAHDRVVPDKVVYTFGKPVECKPFRNAILEKLGDDYDGDKKQVIVDEVMAILDRLHNGEKA